MAFILFCSWLLLFPLSGSDVYALTASAAVNGSTMTVSGQAAAGERLSIMVERSDGKRCYLGQATADHSGNYSMGFSLYRGDYTATVAGNGQQAETARQTITQDPTGGGGGGTIKPIPDPGAYVATVSVTGDAATGVILPDTAWHWTGDCTVLQALEGVLDSQGISYEVRSNGYIARIGNLSEKQPGYPLSGWLFKLNGDFPPSGADSTIIRNGDDIEWVYTMNGGADVGTIPLSLDKLLVINNETDRQMTAMMQEYSSMLSEITSCRLINADKRMTAAEARLLKQKLAANQAVREDKLSIAGGVIYDSLPEVIVLFPENALNGETFVNLTEGKAAAEAVPAADYQPYSSVYKLGPNGSKFAVSVRVAIRLSISPDYKAADLTPAWYDPDTKQWKAIPGIIDLKNGMAVFDTTHFSSFAVVAKAGGQTAVLDQPGPVDTACDYTEVEKDYPWALTAVRSLSQQGIMVGSDRGFEPGRVITRAEMAALLQRSLKAQTTQADIVLIDVPAGAWYYPVMQTAVRSGWISGYPDKTFHPDAVIDRYEAASMLFKAVSSGKSGTINGASPFNDYKQAPAWVQPALQYIGTEGLMHGYPDGSFGGARLLNRAEAAVIIWGMLNAK